MRRVMGFALLASMLAAGCGGDANKTRDGGREAGRAQVPPGVAAQYRTLEAEIRAEGGAKVTGPWRIAYIVEEAEGWFERRDGRFTWRAPAQGETHHLEIIPMEAQTGRIVPEAPVTLEVLSADGRSVARKPLRFYYGEFFHNAANFSIPRPGRYTLRATVEPPPFLRHGEEGEDPPLAQGATVEFENVAIGVEERGAQSRALTEVAETRQLLGQALARYRAGDARAAERLVGDAYLEHFEHVEGPLGQRDHEFMEKLEALISTRIRNAMKRGAAVAEVERLVVEAQRGLDRAATLLR